MSPEMSFLSCSYFALPFSFVHRRRPVELGAAHAAEPGGAARQGHAGRGGPRMGLLRGARLRHQHAHALRGGTWSTPPPSYVTRVYSAIIDACVPLYRGALGRVQRRTSTVLCCVNRNTSVEVKQMTGAAL